jgi:gluconolactonase
VTDVIADGAVLELLYTGTEWAEGPVWLPTTGRLRWSDIPNDRILEYEAATGSTAVYRSGVEFTNGRTLDLDGSVLQCSHGLRRVERDRGGVVTPVVTSWNGHRLNSPNDIVVASDGSIWFTDPPYGIQPSEREGHAGEPEYDGCFVFRLAPGSSAPEPVVTDMRHPNGLAFSLDERLLFVSDTGFGDDEAQPVRSYEISGGVASAGRVFATIDPGPCDGLRVDEEGRIWCSSADGIHVLDEGGSVIARIPVPERVANLCFGGADGHDLYITATTSLYRIRTRTRSAKRPGSP